MPKFKKKPIEIEAVQWTVTKKSFDDILLLGLKDWRQGEMGSGTFFIDTLEGEYIVKEGDWVIRGIEGEFYPCKPGIFASTYDLVK